MLLNKIIARGHLLYRFPQQIAQTQHKLSVEYVGAHTAYRFEWAHMRYTLNQSMTFWTYLICRILSISGHKCTKYGRNFIRGLPCSDFHDQECLMCRSVTQNSNQIGRGNLPPWVTRSSVFRRSHCHVSYVQTIHFCG